LTKTWCGSDDDDAQQQPSEQQTSSNTPSKRRKSSSSSSSDTIAEAKPTAATNRWRGKSSDIHLNAWAVQRMRSDFRKVSHHVPGLRLLRQPPVECTFAFICSQNNNIARIQQLVRKLALHYGSSIPTIQVGVMRRNTITTTTCHLQCIAN
jgi:3-methyladenine DNA glycosylase/8-oxoguanine DNA glycosylase